MRAKSLPVIAALLLVSMLLASCAPTPAPTAVPPTQAPAAAEPTKAAEPTVAAPTNAPAPTAEPTRMAAPPAPEFIDVGASIPLTGKYGSLGNQVKTGYAYAVADINAAGGVYVKLYDKKIPLRLTVYDDESDPTKAVSKMETLFSEQKVTAYLGGAASDMHAATIPIAEKNKVPYLGVSFALWKIHQQGYKYLFSPFVKSPNQGKDIYQYLNDMIPEGQRPLKVAIFQEKTDWGIELGGLWKDNAPTYGYTVVDYEVYAPGTKDYSSMIQKAKAAGAETLLTMPGPPDGIAMWKQMIELNWTPKFTMMIRAPEGVTWADTFKQNADGPTIFPGWHHGEKFPGVDTINERFQKDFGRPADLLVGPAYACVQILADAIQRAGTLDRDAIRDAIAATNMTTVEGPVTFNADGSGNVLVQIVICVF